MNDARPIRVARRCAGAKCAIAAALAAAICAAVLHGAGAGCASAPTEIGGRAASRLLVNKIRPQYPPLARLNYIRGHVRLLVTVGCDGKVTSVHVLRGHPFLALAALQAIRRWIYHPFVTPVGPAAFQTRVDVDFALLGRTATRFPAQPEKFLERGIEPPRIKRPPRPPPRADAPNAIRMRLLVNASGRVVDCTPLTGTPAQFEAAKKVVTRWKFQPARWGNLNVPWYVELDVPLNAPPPAPAVALAAR